MVSGGGLISYGADCVDQYRRTADYLDRSSGAKSRLIFPVQSPTKFELAVNLKTAKSRHHHPPTVFATADQVIE